MKYYTQNGIKVVEVPVRDFRILLYDGLKKSMGKNRCNAGFFGSYSERGEKFTLPSAHLVCDYAATSKWTKKYCEERGVFDGGKFFFDSGAWSHANEFHGKSISTLIVKDGKATIVDTSYVPPCDYAISGVPVMRDGKDVKFNTYVKGQGWSSGNVRATWHILVGLKKDNSKIYVLGMKTTTSNMILSAEAFNKLKALGFRDVIKMDGGGSFYLNTEGAVVSTAENRRVCTIFDFGKCEGNPYAVPTIVLYKGVRNAAAVSWLQWELNSRGYACTVDGSFGSATLKQLKAYQRDHGLVVDGYCGAATRASLTK